jgi:hypothetical protein
LCGYSDALYAEAAIHVSLFVGRDFHFLSAANNALAGPNGIGGITVDGSRKEMKITTDKKGNVNCSFSVQGIGISAQVYITLTNGGNNASARISPNFNSNTLTLNGVLVPLSQSNVYKGRAL